MAVATLRPVDPSFESWWVRPGSATVVELRGDDRITVIDPDGGQPAELTVLSSDGRDDPGALGVTADAPASVLRAGGDDGFLAALHARGLRPHDARALRLFGSDSPPGASQAFRAQRDALVIVAAPGGRLVDGDPPASALVVEIRRAAARPAGDLELPRPLAEPRLDFRVDLASALAYEVRAGEYIQIIDVKGRQCSDFLAFHRGKLERGIERGLDGVTTRTLMGNAYPTPGLQGKFYDVDMDPLVEVVRDTVGRHDTFALACTPKYYEDMGYPGHISCTENFNGQVTPYGIAERKGWEALNFFYNTVFDASNVLCFDEPWSRPGDYVLLRAMTDLVCASSACPDDIDPANGWELDRRPRARLLPREPLLDGDRPPRHPGGRARADPGDDVPSADERADRELRGVPRLLAAPLLQQRGRHRRVLGLPREGRRHGPLPAAQVGGPRARRRDAHPARDHPRRAPPGRGPGRLHGGLQRDRRHDRRRHRLPAGRRQLPLHRRRPLRRRLAQGPRRAPRPEAPT